MNCQEVKEHLSAYIDDELDASLAEKVETHLFRCFECAKLFQETANMTLLLLKVETVPVPASFDRKLRRALQEEKAKQSVGFKKKLTMISGVAAVFVIGIFSIVMFNMGGANGGADNGAAPNYDMLRAIALGDNEHDPYEMRTPLSDWDFDDEDLYYEHPMLIDEEEYLEEEMDEELLEDEYALEDEEMYEEVDADAEYNDQYADEATEETQALAYGDNEETTYATGLYTPAVTTLEHYLNLVTNRFSGYEHRIISYSLDENTGIYTIRVEVVVAVGIQTEVLTFRGQHGNIWQVVVD